METVDWSLLSRKLNGKVATDRTTAIQYATDASIYRTLPKGVVWPVSEEDVLEIVVFARRFGMPLIPRTAGTSLAGQVVGEGLVVDFSHMNAIAEINVDEKWARVQPGVVRDELNHQLHQHGLFFSPNTSTSNRCMIGGMVGNNSCGTTSVMYGTTRDKVLEIRAVLSDGSVVELKSKSTDEIPGIENGDSLEGRIYGGMLQMLDDPSVREEIRKRFPKPDIHRRNTGYALDALLDMSPLNPQGEALNLSKLVTGSEGTLCIVTSVKIALDELPPPAVCVVCAHFHELSDSLRATVVAMKHRPFACELMDGTILELTKQNPEQQENRFFVQGDPGAILCVELRAESLDAVHAAATELIDDLTAGGLGYHFAVVEGEDVQRVWNLRAAGLGVLSNMSGDAKPVAFIEDTAVSLEDLPDYIADFDQLMKRHGKKVVYYAHAGAGELHLRPVLNLKSADDRLALREIARDSAELVAKYRGALSGEHGDGRVRAEFIPLMVGNEVYELFRRVKALWDPTGLFNPGKIVDPQPMDTDLRYEEAQKPFAFDTFLDFSSDGDMLRAAERCNGSGDCRKLPFTGASMCPSYQATRREQDTTRARANVLREVMTRPLRPDKPLVDEAAAEVLDLCLSCKACKRECPSNVDMALLKAETMYRIGKEHGFTRSAKFFASFASNASRAVPLTKTLNTLLRLKPFSRLFKRVYGIAPERSIPAFSTRRASSAIARYCAADDWDFLLYLDEFTEFQDAHVAESAAAFFHALGYRFGAVYAPSGRPAMSKGMLEQAARAVRHLVARTEVAVHKDLPVIGLEPSAVLGMRDDLPKLLRGAEAESARRLGAAAMTFEEFVAREMREGRIGKEVFVGGSRRVHLHTHCHQKSLSHVKWGVEALSFPSGYRVDTIPSGCCGMAGSFGYEKDHYALSMKIGEMVLFPWVRKLGADDVVVTSGTSCRHQIADGTGRRALHPAEVLWSALKK